MDLPIDVAQLKFWAMGPIEDVASVAVGRDDEGPMTDVRAMHAGRFSSLTELHCRRKIGTPFQYRDLCLKRK